MRVGKAYLIHLGDWHTVVGRVAEQLGPLTYALESASKVDIQAFGDRWHELAAGDAELRRGATYWHFAGEAIVPLAIVAVEWAGETPQEAARRSA